MTYPKKIKGRAIQLVNEGHSAEQVVQLLSKEPDWRADNIPCSRTIRNWLSESKTKRVDELLLEKHFTDLAETAGILAHNMQKQRDFGDFLELSTPLSGSDAGINGNIIDGGQVGIITIDGTVDVHYDYNPEDDSSVAIVIKPIDSLLAKCLLEHFKYRFPKLISFQDWREASSGPIEQEIIDKLKLVSFSRNFKICPNCPVCNELMA